MDQYMMNAWQNWHSFWQMPGSMFWPVSGALAVVGGGLILLVLLLILVWSLIWKGLALWKAARSGSAGWFVVLLIINTAGILDILYLYVFSKKYKHVE